MEDPIGPLGLSFNKKNILGILGIVLLVAAIPLAVYLAQQKQIFRPKAAETRVISAPETSLSLGTSTQSVAPGQEFKVSVLARSDIDAANLFAAKLQFPANLLKVKAVNVSSPSAVQGVQIAQACVQVVTTACSPTVKGLCYQYGSPCDVPSGWIIDDNATALPFPTPTPDRYCAQVTTRACSPDLLPVCKEFGSPCDVPDGWTTSRSAGDMCAQVITRACNPQTFECRDFPTPCDVPVGWSSPTNTPAPTVAPTALPTATNTPAPTATPTPIPVDKDYFVNNWVEKVFDNNTGTVSLVGAVVSPGFKSTTGQPSRVMAEIVFTALAEGNATVAFTADSAIYRNSDNQNVLGIKRDLGLNISNLPTSTPTLAPTATPGPTIVDSPKRVFMTSTRYTGNLGGLSGADAKCQARADAADLGGTWKAWISDSITSAASRLTHNTESYKLLNGTIVANNWNDLTDGSIQNSININEFNNLVSGTPWTHTKESGGIFGTLTPCNNWTSGVNGGYTYDLLGNYLKTDKEWTAWPSGTSCNVPQTLYCFEQGTGATSTATTVNTTTSTTVSVPTVTPTPAGILGDVNGDKKITLSDMSGLMSKWNKKGTEAGAANLNPDKDDSINSIDYTMMVDILIKNGVIKSKKDLR